MSALTNREIVASNKSTLWDLAKSDLRKGINPGEVGQEYKVLAKLAPKTGNVQTDMPITTEDCEILKNFLQNRQMTIVDLFTVNNLKGSKIAASLEKLVDFGLIKRDWDKEAQMHTDVVYSLTPEGHYVATKRI